MQFDVIFDNGGGVTLQGDGFAVAYEAHSYTVRQAADDARALLNGADPSDWEGNNEANRETNLRECRVYSSVDLQAEMQLPHPIDARYHGASEREFLAHLTGREIEE
jgi:hypothetical protein